MEAKELQYLFGIQMNQFDMVLELSSDDIQYWLNRGQIELVRQMFSGNNRERRGFEQSQQKIDELQNLIVSNYKVDTESLYNSMVNGFYIDSAKLPINHLYLLNSSSSVKFNFPSINVSNKDITKTTIETIFNEETQEDEEVEVEEVIGKRRTATGRKSILGNRFSQHDDIHKLLSDPFNTTRVDSPLITMSDNYINVYTDKTFIVESVIIDYIKSPRSINIKEKIGSELNSNLKDKLIDISVSLFLNNTRELKQRLQRETPVVDTTQNREEQ